MMKEYMPTGEWRTNALSNVPGGSLVSIQFENHIVHYNNIKRPAAYIDRIFKLSEKEITAIWIDEKLTWQKQ